MVKFFRISTTFTIILFLVVLLIVYAFLPEQVGILFSDNGERVLEISRNLFFYSIIIVFMLSQLIFYLFKNHVLENRLKDTVGNYLGVWFRGLFLSVNLFFIFMIIFIGLANNAVDYSFSSIIYIALVGPILLVSWIFAFPVFYVRYKEK